MSQSIAQRRLSLVLLAFFAASAMLLAAIGVYGVMSFVVAQRTTEIGIRMALGAQAEQVAWHVQRQGMALVGLGLAAGLAGGLVLTRYLSTLLFKVTHAIRWYSADRRGCWWWCRFWRAGCRRGGHRGWIR